MSLEELRKATWLPLQKGIEYISLEHTHSRSFDSIQYSLIGLLQKNAIVTPLDFGEIQPVAEPILSPILNEQLPKSKRGYIKLNLNQAFKPFASTAMIYLIGDTYDSLELQKDMSTIRSINGITEVRFLSKEKAKEIYLDAGNQDWENILTENPLPNAIEADFDSDIITSENYEQIKEKIESSIGHVSDIHFPGYLMNKSKEKNYCIFEYNRY